MTTIAALQARLSGLKTVKVELSQDEKEEAKIREQIAAEEERITSERAAKRKLENARILEAAKANAGPDVVAELVDLEEQTPGAGVYVMRNPPPMVSDALQKAIRERGKAETLDIANFVIGSMLHPDPETHGVEVRDTFDRFGFAAQSLSNVAMRLGGLKIEQERRKS